MNHDKVCCFNVKFNSNIGMIMRTASLFGMGEVIVLGRRRFDSRSSVGADHFIPIQRINACSDVYNEQLDVNKITNIFQSWAQNYNLVFIELCDRDIDFR